jgi:hypothetical protein
VPIETFSWPCCVCIPSGHVIGLIGVFHTILVTVGQAQGMTKFVHRPSEACAPLIVKLGTPMTDTGAGSPVTCPRWQTKHDLVAQTRNVIGNTTVTNFLLCDVHQSGPRKKIRNGFRNLYFNHSVGGWFPNELTEGTSLIL